MNEEQYMVIPEPNTATSPRVHSSFRHGKNLVVGQDVVIDENVEVGDDCFLGHGVKIRSGVKIGDRACLRIDCLIDPDVVIGDDFEMFPKAIVGGSTIVGNKVYWGPYALTTNNNLHRKHRPQVNGEVKINAPIVEDGVVLMSFVSVAPGVIIRRNCIIGMCSALTKSTNANEVWFGNPAKMRREVAPEDRLTEDAVEAGWPYSINDIDYLKTAVK